MSDGIYHLTNEDFGLLTEEQFQALWKALGTVARARSRKAPKWAAYGIPAGGRLPLKPCLYCGSECAATWSPADAKADKFPACNWVHATMVLVRRAEALREELH